MSAADPEIGLIVVGDEILAGRRPDRHMSAVIERLGARGLALTWATYTGDDRARLAALLRRTMASDALVFCCGGIGATPDDVTRQAAADAAGLSLQRHAAGAEILVERFGGEATDARLRMVDFPAGARLIPNPVNQVPGFQLAQHCFVPGFPRMAWPMIEWVLDTQFAAWCREPAVSRSVRVHARESDLVPLLEALGAEHPGVRFSSLPEMQGARGYVVELGVHGPGDAVEPAFAALERGLDAHGVPRADP
jgi:molybdopterin-biosynthesis enzyme MoeA-like protein